MRFLTVIITFLLLLTSGCSMLSKKRDVATVENVGEIAGAEKPTDDEMSEVVAHIREAQSEAKSDDDNSRIIGSADIEKPNNHHGKTYFLYGAEHLNLENYYFDIPVVYNKKVQQWINYFLTRGRGFFERYSARAGRYAPLMGKILEEHGLPRDLIFLAMAESGFQNKAKSWARAVGPWQFMPFTGQKFGLDINWYKDERRDPIKATIAASKYLSRLYQLFGSWELAAAGYNAGEGKVSRAIRRYRTENFWRLSQGRYLRNETKNYVPKIMALAIIGKNLKSFGFEEIDFYEPLDFEEIDVEPMTDLYQVAEVISVDFEEIQRLNPEILRWFTPPTENYKLRIPVGTKVVWDGCCTDTKFIASDFMEYKVRGSNSKLHQVARKYKIKDKFIDVITHLNKGLTKHTTLSKGQIVYLPFKKGQDIKDNMYADLYELPRKSVQRRRSYKKRINLALRRGRRITSPSAYYTVQRGDSLWTVARKNGVSLDTLIVSNLKLIKRRMIRAGDRLVVR